MTWPFSLLPWWADLLVGYVFAAAIYFTAVTVYYRLAAEVKFLPGHDFAAEMWDSADGYDEWQSEIEKQSIILFLFGTVGVLMGIAELLDRAESRLASAWESVEAGVRNLIDAHPRTRAARNWAFEPREWTSKTYSDMEYGNDVRIYDHDTSPAHIATTWLIAIPFYALAAGITYLMATSTPASTAELIVNGVATLALVIPIDMVVVGLTIKKVTGWYERHFGMPDFCEECATPSRYPHTFTHKTGISDEVAYSFCSQDCRKAWEREHIDYSFSGYCDIQDSTDEDDVKRDHYSSAWETQETA